MSCQSCKGLQPPAPAFPPTIILSCRECQRPAPLVPMRSTFCYDDTNKGKYLTNADRINRRRAWEIFEKVENKDSAVRAMLADTVPGPQGGAPDRIFHIFENDEERVLYKTGQRAHIAQYPNIKDFEIPYANKPIQYTSTVIAATYSAGLVFIFTAELFGSGKFSLLYFKGITKLIVDKESLISM